MGVGHPVLQNGLGPGGFWEFPQQRGSHSLTAIIWAVDPDFEYIRVATRKVTVLVGER
jgi:hypothetical protein